MFAIVFLVVAVSGLLQATGALAGVKEEYFLVRQDTRKCAFPACGGFFLDPVNVDKFDCPRGEVSRKGECYVAEIRGVTVGPALSLVRGKFVPYSGDINAFEALEGYEGKINPHPAKNNDAFLAISDVGINCIAAPCNTFHGTKLNERSFERDVLMFADIDLSRFKASEEAVRDEMRHNDVILTASTYKVEGAAGTSLGLTVSNVFTRMADPPKPCKTRADCNKSEFCSKPSCSAMYGLCQIKPQSCTKNIAPVCSCDGLREFDNDCIRQLFGVLAATNGKCTTPVE